MITSDRFKSSRLLACATFGLVAKPNKHCADTEEHDSGTGLLASVEAGRGIALVTENVAAIAGPRVKIRKLVPEPPPIVVGVAYVEKALTTITKSFVTAARRASSKR